MIWAARMALFVCLLEASVAAPPGPAPAPPALPVLTDPPVPPAIPGAGAVAGGNEDRAARKYEEMLSKMQAAVEEIAELYGNPSFLQVYTNDEDKASELKLRLASAGREKALRHDLEDLEKKREDVLGEIALREKESRRLTEKLVRQRAALDALSSALDQARKVSEDSAR